MIGVEKKAEDASQMPATSSGVNGPATASHTHKCTIHTRYAVEDRRGLTE
jgi:hypothetical protein